MSVPIITLTTDWGHQGFFTGMVKGRLYSMLQEVQVVDITHHLEPFGVLEASFVVRHGCLGFPAGTVHIVDVASNPVLEDPFVAVKARGQYFICCNNGLLSLALGGEVEEAVSLPLQENRIYNFAAHSVFAPAAARLLSGTPLGELGSPVQSLRQRIQPGWIKQGNEYRIPIQYFDSYGNAYLAMTYHEFVDIRQGRPFVMQVRDIRLNEVVSSYHQPPSQPRRAASSGRELCLTVSATGFLELAVSNSSFAQLFGLRTNEMVLLEFR